MTATTANPRPAPVKDRVLVTADHHRISDFLRDHYPCLEVATVDSYLQAIWSVSQQPPRAVIGSVDPAFAHLDQAVDALRKAAGSRTRLLLCCSPEAEPAARSAVTHGADGYVVAPLCTEDLDQALDYGRTRDIVVPKVETLAPTASMAELHGLAELLAGMEAEPAEFLSQLTTWVRHSFHASWAECTVEGSIVRAGAAGSEAALSEAMKNENSVVGQLTLGPRTGRAYGMADTLKLRHFALLAARLLEVSRRAREWRNLAQVDEVTELPNRRRLLSFLEEILERASAERFSVTVLLFDIDNFKHFNDQFGHAVGDDIIKLIGPVFRSCCREQDLVTRYGGDEFAVVFWDAGQPRVPGSRHPTDALAVLHRFKAALSHAQHDVWKHLPQSPLTISGGLASYPWDGATPEALLTLADHALLKAKRDGKNRVYLIGDGDVEHVEKTPVA